MRNRNDILIPEVISGPEVTWRDKLISMWNRMPFWIIATVVAIIVCTAFVTKGVKQIIGSSESSMLTRTLLPEEEPLLEGIYSMKSHDSEGRIHSVADVKGSNGYYQITIYSEYSPLNFESYFLSDGTLICEGLGEGKVNYKPSTGSINVSIIKGGKEICELSK